MSDKTGIEWTDATWNPVTGCTEVSPGCDNCYAKTLAERFRGTPGHYFEHGFEVQLREDKLALPHRWTKPRRIFVNSMSDLFHDAIPEYYIAHIFAIMATAPQHTFQVLTKRHARMRSLISSPDFLSLVSDYIAAPGWTWPLPNVWLGVSTEDQQWADIRIPALLETPAAVRFISAEPLLGPIDLANVGGRNVVTGEGNRVAFTTVRSPRETHIITPTCIAWVIVGGESGRGARPMNPNWVLDLRDQCRTARIPFLFKQWGEYQHLGFVREDTGIGPLGPGELLLEANAHGFVPLMRRVGKKQAGRMLGGRTWDEYPEAVTA